jgi:uncharacterized protein (DUF58 family)
MPRRSLRQRIDGWTAARTRRQAGPVEIVRGRIYILPTRFGCGFALMLAAMLLGAMNYSNSMMFLMSFLLAGLGLVCMHHTHANLVRLRARAGHSRPVFAGEQAQFEVLVDNPSSRARWALNLAWRHQAATSATAADAPPQDAVSLALAAPARVRGWQQAGTFRIATEFPLGLFHAWTYVELDMQCLVYPQPVPVADAPPAGAGRGGLSSAGRSGHEEYAGLRVYQPGDSLRSIHWKSLPKTRMPMVKQFAETLERELVLDWHTLAQPDTETRLSVLARWVLDADAAGHAYGLRLPGRSIEPARGEAHRHRCLRALALHGIERP